MTSFSKLRDAMVEHQIAARGVSSKTVLNVMRKVPGDAFLADRTREFAYADAPLPIESDPR